MLILRNAALLDAAAPEPRKGMCVAIEGDRIREIAEHIRPGSGDRQIDLGGRTLMPGLIDAHVHAIGVTTDLHALALMPPYLVAAKAMELLRGMLDRGFTTVRDAGGADWGLAEAVRLGHFAGPRMFVSALALAQTGGQGDFRVREEKYLGCPCCRATRSLSRIVDGVDDVTKAVREELRKGADQIKIMASGGMVSRIPINRSHFSMAELRAAVEEAAAAETYVMAHAYESHAVRRCVEAGVKSIEHGNLIDRPTAELMAKRNVYIVPTMSVYEAYHKHGRELGFPQTVIDQFAELMKSAVIGLDNARSAGVRIAHGSDLEGILHQYQSREFLLKAQVMTPHETIVAATATSAELIGRQGQLGIIAEGALADLIALDGDPLKNLELLGHQGAHMPFIMQGGRIYKDLVGH